MKTSKQAEDLIRLLCSSCGKRVKVSPKFAGQTGKCPKCGHPVEIPPLSVLEQKVKEIKGKANNTPDQDVDVPDLPEQTTLTAETRDKISFNMEDPPEPTAELLGLEDDSVTNQQMLVPETPVEVGFRNHRLDTVRSTSKPMVETKVKPNISPKSGVIANTRSASIKKNSPGLSVTSAPKNQNIMTPNLPMSSNQAVLIPEIIGDPIESPEPEQIFAEQQDWPEELAPLDSEITEAQVDEAIPIEAQLEEVKLEEVKLEEVKLEEVKLEEVKLENIDDIALLEEDVSNLPAAVPISTETVVETASSALSPQTIFDATHSDNREIIEIQEIHEPSSDFNECVEEDMERDLIAIDKLLANCRSSASQNLMVGKSALEATNLDTALQYLSTCINSNEDIGFAYYLRSFVYIQKKAWSLALEDLKSALDFGYQDSDVEDLHNKVILQEVIHLRNLGAYREALRILDQVVSKNITIEKGKIYWMRAKFLIQSGAKQSALRDLEEAILHNYLKPEIFEARGRIYLEAGDYASAMHDFVSAINRGGKSASLYQARSETYFFMKDMESALQDIQMAQSLSPEDPILLDFEALILNEKKLYDASDVALDKAEDLSSDNSVHQYNRGMCYMRRGRYDRAIESLTKVIDVDHKDRVAFFKRAICYQEKSNPNLGLSREDFKKAELLEPQSFYRTTPFGNKKKK